MRSHGMLPIQAQFCTGWEQLAWTNWITARDGSLREMNCSWSWIAVRAELRSETQDNRRILPGDGSRKEMICDQIRMDDWRWKTADGSPEMNHGRPMTINRQSYTMLPSYNREQIGRHFVFRRNGSKEYNTEHYSKHYFEILNHAPTCPSYNAEYDVKSVPEPISCNANRIHHDTAWDMSSMVQQSFKRRMTVPDSQQPLLQTITIPKV